jgi:DNA-binding GntR family transcriptional regulator
MPSVPDESLAAADRIAMALRDDIMTGLLLPGTRLKDAQLAERFDVSRNTLREAVRLLVTAGLAVTRRNAGSAVREVSEADAREIYAVRRTLELAGVQASSAAPADRLGSVRAAVASSQQACAQQRWSDVGTASLGFHRAIVSLNGSARIDQFFSNNLAQLRLVFAVMSDEAEFQMQWVDRDAAIAEHLLGGRRREAAAALSQYLADSEALIIDAIRASASGRSRGPRTAQPVLT